MFEIPTWQPYGNDIVQQMRRFFTGGAPELQDNTYVKVPTEAEVSPNHFYIYICVDYFNVKGRAGKSIADDRVIC